ncbi:uncharacterized protein LOC144582330 isoform X2 [Callithrix jacchus]
MQDTLLHLWGNGFLLPWEYTELKEEQDGQVLDCSCSQAGEEAHEGPGRLPQAIPAPACSEAPHLEEEDGQQRPWAAFRRQRQKPPCQMRKLRHRKVTQDYPGPHREQWSRHLTPGRWGLHDHTTPPQGRQGG